MSRPVHELACSADSADSKPWMSGSSFASSDASGILAQPDATKSDTTDVVDTSQLAAHVLRHEHAAAGFAMLMAIH